MTDPTHGQIVGQITLDLEALFRAGRYDFPAKAEELTGYGTHISNLLDQAQAEAAKAADVTSLVFNDLQETHYLLYEAVRRCVGTMNDIAEGCLAAAQQFQQAEGASAEAYQMLSSELPGLTSQTPVPPAPDLPTRPDPTA